MESDEDEEFANALSSAYDVRGVLNVRRSAYGRGLFMAGGERGEAARGDVVLSVPKKLALYIQVGRCKLDPA